MSYFLEQVATAPLEGSVRADLRNYLDMTGAWTGTDAQLQAKSSGMVHLLVGSPEYQFQ